ncbi:MAG TPA: hypothetical protein VHT05_01110 [Candidatus Elarobacter sp.]|jgi:hypothetical protein|nr:hypothetical protein [Candidatus Elarobacter sp.]
MARLIAVGAALVAAGAATTRPAQAIPLFAHRYGFTCQVCHTVIPHLNPFGTKFLAAGYRIPGLKPKPVFPVAVRVESSYASGGAADPDDATTGPLPKFIVNEVEFLTGGAMGTRGSYWAEIYAVDGGEPGRPRDVWAAWRATPDNARIPVTFRAGEFTLPLPLDPETFRETTQPYAIWSQTAGGNPFDFFDTKIGGQIVFGDTGRQIGGSVSFLQGHDTASGLPAHGVDTMVTLQRDLGDFSLSAYRYDGSRDIQGTGFQNTQTFDYGDRFWRDGFGVGWGRNGTRVDAVYQTGNDAKADVYGDALQTSGAFVQVRQEITPRVFALARWDATQDATFARSVTYGGGFRFSRNTRLTLFDTGERDFTGRLIHVVSSSLLFAL